MTITTESFAIENALFECYSVFVTLIRIGCVLTRMMYVNTICSYRSMYEFSIHSVFVYRPSVRIPRVRGPSLEVVHTYIRMHVCMYCVKNSRTRTRAAMQCTQKRASEQASRQLDEYESNFMFMKRMM